MQVVFAVVGLQLVPLAADGKGRILDAVGIPPHERAAAGAGRGVEIGKVIGKMVVSKHHVHRAVLGGYQNVFDHAAVVEDVHFEPAGIGEDVLVDLIAVFQNAKRHGTKLCHRGSPP